MENASIRTSCKSGAGNGTKGQVNPDNRSSINGRISAYRLLFFFFFFLLLIALVFVSCFVSSGAREHR